jgi:hypothetical protein
MPRSAFATMKEEDRLGLGVQGDGAAWLAEARRMLDFNLKRLAHRARSGKLEGVRLEAGTLIVTPTTGEVPAAADELNAEVSDMYPMVEVPDLLREVHDWTGFADHFTHVRTGDIPRNVSAMLAGVLADATNLGPKRMAAHPKASALTRSAGCAPTLGRKPIALRKHASPMHIPDIRILASGATARHLRQMANSSARVTEPQSAATSICTTAASRARSFTAICPTSMATSASCRSAQTKARRPMCSMDCSIRTQFSTSRNTFTDKAVQAITSSGCLIVRKPGVPCLRP